MDQREQLGVQRPELQLQQQVRQRTTATNCYCLRLLRVSSGCQWQRRKRTKFVADPSTSSETTYTSSCKHGSGVALFVLFLLLLIGSVARRGVVMSLVSMSIAKEAALIVAAWGDVRCT